MKPYYQSSVIFSFLYFSFCLAHTESQSGSNNNNNNNNGPLFGSVMRYFGESETGYGLPSSGLFEDVETSQQQVSMCLPNFEVSVGSIIRTKDSQALGAHYLNETDLGAKSRDECLKLCCKISRCNVAVFEEKNSGSCYLFDCGSLEDFRCKFTTQTHFVSAILRHREIAPQHNSNGSPEHSGSIMVSHINAHSHNQHEDELSQLRESDKTSGPQTAVVPAAMVAAGASNLPDVSSKSKQTGGVVETAHGGSSGGGGTSTISSSTTSPVVLSDVNNVVEPGRRCSRWQFECKSSGECIAIYNVCDAIPNCPDGSDESPELHCPANNGYPGSVDVTSNANKPKDSLQQQPQLSSQQQTHHPQPPVPILQKSPTLTNDNSGSSVINGLKSQAPLRQSEEYPQIPNNLKPQPVGDGPVINVPRKNDQSVFNHKGVGVMEDAFGSHTQSNIHYPGQYWKQPSNSNYDYGNGESQPGYGPLPPPPQYSNNLSPYAGTNYGNAQQFQYNGYPNLQSAPQQSPPQGLPMLPQGQPQYTASNNNYSPQQTLQQPYYNRQSTSALQGNTAVIPGPVSGGQSTGAIQATNGVSQQTQNLNPSNKQLQSQITTSKPSVVAPGAPKEINDSNKGSLSKLESDFIKSLKAQSLQSGSSDVQSEELSPHTAGAGAVFIFILGLGMSIVMVIIVGCRLRRVGRRQRGKNRLDPDYLVDGMYL